VTVIPAPAVIQKVMRYRGKRSDPACAGVTELPFSG